LLLPTLPDFGFFAAVILSETWMSALVSRGDARANRYLRSPNDGELGALRDLKTLSSGGGI